MGGKELKWHQLAQHQFMSQSKTLLVHTVQLKPKIKAHFSGRMLSSGIGDVVIDSVHSEKPFLEVHDNNNYYNK